MTTLETAITVAFVLLLVYVLAILVLLSVGPELETWLKLHRLQKCYDACAASYEIGVREHQACTDICLAKYHMDGEE